MKRKNQKPGMTVRILCALALLFLGFAHRPAVEADVRDVAALAYQLPDGTQPDLCVPQGPEKLKFSYPACDACRLTAAVILPDAPDVAAYPAGSTVVLFAAFAEEGAALTLLRAQTARGPPSFLFA